MKKILITLILIFSCSITNAQDEVPAIDYIHKKEHIIKYHSDILIDSTGRVQVIEHITLLAKQEDIRRGIIRSIPIYRADAKGKKKKVDITVLSVVCDDKPEEYSEEIGNKEKEIHIGGDDLLTIGVHKYVITYESYGHIGFFDTFDEIYWNVTGNSWYMPIDSVSARVTLPNNSHYINTACYTGVKGSTDKECSFESIDGNVVDFVTDHDLIGSEGFTVAVSFPRDIVKRPPPPSKEEIFREKYGKTISAVLGLIVLFGFCLITWIRVGRNPQKRIVVPTFNLPYDWSPATMRYLYTHEIDNKTFTAAIVSMAVKGAITIFYVNRKYTIECKNNKVRLSKEEKAVYDYFITKSTSIVVSDHNSAIFSKAYSKFSIMLKKCWNIKDYFKENKMCILMIRVLGAIILLSYLMFNKLFDSDIIVQILLALVVMPFVIFGISNIIQAIISFSDSIKERVISLFMGAFISALIVFVIPLLLVDWISALFIIGVFLELLLYTYFIKAPTQLGAQTKAELDGFKMYLETAEEHRLNILTPPERTPQLFEAFLPYALALGVENKWGEKFDDVLKRYSYDPSWYRSDTPLSVHSFTQSFSGSFTSSVSSANSSSSSSGGSWSSGSSGGGSSGGGGGGGGGRGR